MHFCSLCRVRGLGCWRWVLHISTGRGVCPCRERGGLVGLLVIEKERNWEREINRYGLRRINVPWTEGDNGREPLGSPGEGCPGGGGSLQGRGSGGSGAHLPQGPCGLGAPSGRRRTLPRPPLAS